MPSGAASLAVNIAPCKADAYGDKDVGIVDDYKAENKTKADASEH